MAQGTLERRVEHIERRLTAVKQFLPTLATKADVAKIEAAVAQLPTTGDIHAEIQAAIAPLATRTELQAAIAPLATRAEMSAAIREEGVTTRRRFDLVAEGLRADIRMIAEGIVAVQARCDLRHHDVVATLTRPDRRLMRLEASPSKRR